jgi:hypothetical protein
VADVVDVLLAQHALVEDLFRETLAATGTRREEVFAELVRVLGVHEAAEEAVVHPLAAGRIDSGHAVVDSRLTEERLATQLIGDLVELGTDAPDFESNLLALRTSVLIHARHEERYEFTHLRHAVPAEELVSLVAEVRALEGVAGTQP